MLANSREHATRPTGSEALPTRKAVGRAPGFLRQAQLRFDLLARSPGIGRDRAFRSRRLRGIRSHAIRGFPNYIVFYRATRTRLLIVRVLHGMRNLDAIFEE